MGSSPSRSSTTQSFAAPSRSFALDLFRVLGICVVITLLHSQGYVMTDEGRSLAFPRGWYFLILDLSLGFVTAVSSHALAVSRRHRGEEPLAVYLKRRVFRTWPMYAVALCVFIAAWFLGRSVAWYLAQLTCTGVLLSGVVGEPVSTLWYVQLQLVYSFTAGCVLVLVDRSKRLLVVSILGAALLVWCLVTGIGDERLVLYAPAYLVGFAAARSGSRRGVKILCFTAGLIAATCVVMFAATADPTAMLLLRATVPALLYPLSFDLVTRFSAKFDVRWVHVAAYASYGAYLFHRPVLSGLNFFIKPENIPFALAVFPAIGVVLSFVVGGAIQNAYDRIRLRFGVL